MSYLLLGLDALDCDLAGLYRYITSPDVAVCAEIEAAYILIFMSLAVILQYRAIVEYMSNLTVQNRPQLHLQINVFTAESHPAVDPDYDLPIE